MDGGKRCSFGLTGDLERLLYDLADVHDDARGELFYDDAEVLERYGRHRRGSASSPLSCD